MSLFEGWTLRAKAESGKKPKVTRKYGKTRRTARMAKTSVASATWSEKDHSDAILKSFQLQQYG